MTRTRRIKDQHAESRVFSRRTVIAGVVVAVCFAILIGRLTYLQVMRYDYFADLSQGNRIRIEPIPPNRGLILDRNGVALATNQPTYQLELIREQVPDVDRTLQGLVDIGLLQHEQAPMPPLTLAYLNLTVSRKNERQRRHQEQRQPKEDKQQHENTTQPDVHFV